MKQLVGIDSFISLFDWWFNSKAKEKERKRKKREEKKNCCEEKKTIRNVIPKSFQSPRFDSFTIVVPTVIIHLFRSFGHFSSLSFVIVYSTSPFGLLESLHLIWTRFFSLNSSPLIVLCRWRNGDGEDDSNGWGERGSARYLKRLADTQIDISPFKSNRDEWLLFNNNNNNRIIIIISIRFHSMNNKHSFTQIDTLQSTYLLSISYWIQWFSYGIFYAWFELLGFTIVLASVSTSIFLPNRATVIIVLLLMSLRLETIIGT